MKRLFILSVLLAMIVYNKCEDSECALKKDTKDLTDEICKGLKTSNDKMECHVNDEGTACVEKEKASSGETGKKEETGKTESSKSTSASSMIKISLFLLISMLFI